MQLCCELCNSNVSGRCHLAPPQVVYGFLENDHEHPRVRDTDFCSFFMFKNDFSHSTACSIYRCPFCGSNESESMRCELVKINEEIRELDAGVYVYKAFSCRSFIVSTNGTLQAFRFRRSSRCAQQMAMQTLNPSQIGPTT